MRVKDFSTDAVLQAQIRAAYDAGRGDRAGTALHLHVDRFVNCIMVDVALTRI